MSRCTAGARPRPGGPARVRMLATPTGQRSPWPAGRRPVEHCRHERRRRSPTSARPGTGRGRDGRRRPGDAWDVRTAGGARVTGGAGAAWGAWGGRAGFVEAGGAVAPAPARRPGGRRGRGRRSRRRDPEENPGRTGAVRGPAHEPRPANDQNDHGPRAVPMRHAAPALPGPRHRAPAQRRRGLRGLPGPRRRRQGQGRRRRRLDDRTRSGPAGPGRSADCGPPPDRAARGRRRRARRRGRPVRRRRPALEVPGAR